MQTILIVSNIITFIILCCTIFFFTKKQKNIPKFKSNASNDNNRFHFINTVNDYLISKEHFIIVAVVIDQLEELNKKYTEKEIADLMKNLHNFFEKIFPANKIYHYDNMNFVMIFDNKHSMTSTGAIIDEIVSIFNMPWSVGNTKEKLSVTISSLFCPEDSSNIAEIIDILRISTKEVKKDNSSSIVYGKDYIYNREKKLNNLATTNRQLEIVAKEAMHTRTAIETADKRKNLFLAEASHEVRTQLNSILGLSELLLKDNLSDSSKNKAENIKLASSKLFDIFKNLLDFFDIDSDEKQISKEEISTAKDNTKPLNTTISYKNKNFKETFTAKKAEILVVDDNRLNREITKGLLQPYKVNVTTANSGEECLELVKKNIYDLIFMDHLMPKMNGIDTKNHIRQMNGAYFQEVPIVILTANVSGGNRSDFLSQGFAEYIPKPIDIALLDSVLKKVLPDELIDETQAVLKDSSKPFGGILPEIKGMDKKTALDNFNNDTNRLLEELEKFSNNGPNIIAELEHSIINNDYSLYLMYLTNLIEGAEKFGMKKLVKIGNAHEKAAQENNLDFIKKNYPFLAQAYKKFFNQLN